MSERVARNGFDLEGGRGPTLQRAWHKKGLYSQSAFLHKQCVLKWGRDIKMKEGERERRQQ